MNWTIPIAAIYGIMFIIFIAMYLRREFLDMKLRGLRREVEQLKKRRLWQIKSDGGEVTRMEERP